MNIYGVYKFDNYIVMQHYGAKFYVCEMSY